MVKACYQLSLLLIWMILLQGQIYAQDFTSGEPPDEITITLDEAIQIALLNNYLLRRGLLDIDMADEQIREAWGSVYPQLNASGNYTRNIISPNPFAGSDAGGLFATLGSLQWLAYNESARTDGDPATDPISFEEFTDRQQEGFRDAGISPVADDNPFAVDNQFDFGLSLTQTIYNGAAFAAIRGARHLRQINQDQFQREQQVVVNQIKNGFYTALLSQEQTRVIRSSVERLERTVRETEVAVEAGVLSEYDRISAEVELVNLETNLIEAESQAELSVKNLSLQLGIPVNSRVRLRGSLEFDPSMEPGMLDTYNAYQIALERRPDLNQADSYIDLLGVNRRMTQAGYMPTVNAFANFGYIGQVPGNRQQIIQDSDDEFAVTVRNRGFLSDAYWNPALAVGVSLQWNIFNGFQTRSRVQQSHIEIRQAEIDQEMLQNSIYLEVDQVVSNLETSYRRIQSQERNIEQAQANYNNSLSRLREGVGTTLEERQASSLLDQSRLNYLSAVYDYLTALSQYRMVTGEPVTEHIQ